MRTVVLRVTALAVLLFLVLSSVLILQTMRRLPDTVLYFVADEGSHFALAPVGRRNRGAQPEERARNVIEELARGPEEAQRERDLSTALPHDLEIRDVSYEDGILKVDLSRELTVGGGSAQMQARLYQLFYSLTQPADVDGVILEVEGEPVRALGGEGILVDSPWLRAQHEELPVW